MSASTSGEPDPLAAQLVQRLTTACRTIAVAESLTGGLVSAALTEVPGSSACVRGGIVSYATDLKAELLGVDQTLLAQAGPVDPRVAAQMAEGVARACVTDVGLATTGVAGPTEQGGVAVGTVFIAIWSPDPRECEVSELALHGDRAHIRRQTVTAMLTLALDRIDPENARQQR